MKSSDLRIGNYVLANGKITKVIDVLESGINQMRYDVEYDLEDLEPIELTEEILLKCGFEKEILEPKHYCIKGMCIWKCNDMFLCDKNGVHIKYLHQLQNLYFALTNEELNLQL